jgi:putative acetyltransferase
VLARLGSSPVGCGALQPLGDGYGEIKRMYTAPAWRGRGLARQVLAALETRAAEAGWHTLRLETGRDMPAARALYAAAGYAEIPNFGHYVGYPASLCLEKGLPTPLS